TNNLDNRSAVFPACAPAPAVIALSGRFMLASGLGVSLIVVVVIDNTGLCSIKAGAFFRSRDGPRHGFRLVAKFGNYFRCDPFENDCTFLGNPEECIPWFQVILAPIVQRYSEIQTIANTTRRGLFYKLIHNYIIPQIAYFDQQLSL